MSVWRKSNIIIFVSCSIALLLTSCLEDKSSQCRRLIQVVNAGNSLIEQNKGEQVITSFQLSKDLDAITTSLKELNLTDPNLQDIQGRFAKVFQNLSQAIAKASKALSTAKTAEASSTGRDKLQKARTEIDTVLTNTGKTVGKESDMLVEELNQYCAQPQ